MKCKIEVSNNEAILIVYALKEMASRRQEQSIDQSSPALAEEADTYSRLADRLGLYGKRTKTTRNP